MFLPLVEAQFKACMVGWAVAAVGTCAGTCFAP